MACKWAQSSLNFSSDSSYCSKTGLPRLSKLGPVSSPMQTPLGAAISIRTDDNRVIQGRPLGEDFFDRPTPLVAWDLLGKVLVRRSRGRPLAGRIVEAEAYLGGDDPACHAAAGRTERNEIFYTEPPHGRVYVFVSFGLHHCVNILTSGEKPAGCVLLRSIEPLAGIRRMKANRQTSDVRQLTSGPGRLTEALGITKDLNGTSIAEGPLLVVDCDDFCPFVPTADVRIGLTKDRNYPLRYFLLNNQYVSHPRTKLFTKGE